MYQVVIANDGAKIRSRLASLFLWDQLGSEITGSFFSGRGVYDSTLSTPMDLIPFNIRMPPMDGLELLECLLSQKKAKITFFSSFQDFKYMRKTLCDGIFSYLLEPIKYENLADRLTRVEELLDSEKSQDTPDVCESLSHYEEIITMVKNRLDTDYQDVTLEQATRSMSLSPNYLSRIMKEHSSTSFSDYLLEIWMENTTRILMDIDYRQHEIAYQVGYDSPKNFSRAFHQYFSMTPTQYRSCGSRPEPHP